MVMLRLPGESATDAGFVVLPYLVSTSYTAVAGPAVTASNLLSTASMAGSPVGVPAAGRVESEKWGRLPVMHPLNASAHTKRARAERRDTSGERMPCGVGTVGNR